MVSCLMGDSTALASAIVRCCPKFVLFGDTLYLLKKVSTPNADYAAENETQLYTLNQIVHYA